MKPEKAHMEQRESSQTLTRKSLRGGVMRVGVDLRMTEEMGGETPRDMETRKILEIAMFSRIP